MPRKKRKRGWRRRVAEVRLPGKVASLGPDAWAEVEAEARRIILENDTPRVRYALRNLSPDTGRKLSEIGLARPVRNGKSRYFVAEGDLKKAIESEIQKRARWRRNKRKKFPRGMEPNPQSYQEDKGAVFENQVSARNGSQVQQDQEDKGAVLQNRSFRAEWLATPEQSVSSGCSSNDVANVQGEKLQGHLPEILELAGEIARKLLAATRSQSPSSSSPPITPLTTTPPGKALPGNGSPSTNQHPLPGENPGEPEREKPPRTRRGESEGGTSNSRKNGESDAQANQVREPALPGFEAVENPKNPTGLKPLAPAPSHKLLVDLWARYCPHLPQPTSWNNKRKKAWAARCREPGYLENLERLVAGIGRSSHCAGKNSTGWRATVDFAMQARWPELLERYGSTPAQDQNPQITYTPPRNKLRRNRPRASGSPQSPSSPENIPT